MRCLLEERAPLIHGDGEQTRDFTFVDDVVSLLMKASRAGEKAVGRVYNAGNGNRYSLNQVWRTLGEITGVKIEPQYGPSREGDVRDSQADTTAAVRDLGHAPQFALEQGLRRTFEWYREHAATLSATR
jgi:UDP-glucose 4-epimerase